MFYVLFIQSEQDFQKFKNYILMQLSSLVKDINIYEDSVHKLIMECVAFKVRVTDKNIAIKFTCEDYGLELKYLLWFDLYYSEDRRSDQMMMQLIGRIIQNNEGQCILLANGDIPVLEKREETVVVGDSRIYATPFSYLNIDYVEGQLTKI